MRTEIGINIDGRTRLVEVDASGGKMIMTFTEAEGLYILLSKALGFKGRMKLFFRKKRFSRMVPDQ